MSSRSKIPEAIQEQVRQRASYLCEYCHASEQWQYVRFTIDHVIPPTGQATVAALVLNRERVINIRAADKAIRRHPPPGDPIQQLNE